MPSAQTRTNPSERAVGRPDALDLYETLMVAAGDVKAAANSIYWHDDASAAHRWRNDVRAAANRIIAALDAFEGDQT